MPPLRYASCFFAVFAITDMLFSSFSADFRRCRRHFATLRHAMPLIAITLIIASLLRHFRYYYFITIYYIDQGFRFRC